jgi:hypothetical protein
MKTKLFQLSTLILISILFAVTSCQKNSDSNYAGSEKGKLVVKLTDAPFPIDLIDKALVTIDKIEIRSTADSLNSDEKLGISSFIVISEKTQQFNLLDLRNGITADLLELSIDTGTYDLIRMHVVEGEIILKDGTTFNMKIPGGKNSSLKIKIKPELVVEGGITNEVLLDFDVSKSFIVQGSVKAKKGIKGFMFKPVIRAVSQAISASVMGKVVDGAGVPLGGASVQILQGDSIMTSSLTNPAGEYVMIGIPAGTYKMVGEKEGYTTLKVDGVLVEPKHRTVQNFELIKQ